MADMKFGIEDLADKMGIAPASARIKLRGAGIKKAPDGRYGWASKGDMEGVIEKLSKPAKSATKGKADDKPAKGAKDKPAAKDSKKSSKK